MELFYIVVILTVLRTAPSLTLAWKFLCYAVEIIMIIIILCVHCYNKLSSVALTAVQTNMSLVFRQKSTEKRMQNECQLPNCSTQEDQRPQSCVYEYSPGSWNNETSTVSRLKVSSARYSCDRHTVVGQIWKHHVGTCRC